MRYVVVGIYRDNMQVWAHPVESDDPAEAARRAVLDMLWSNNWGPMQAGMLLVVEVLEGDPKFALNNTDVVSGDELVHAPKEWTPKGRRK